MNSSTKSTTNEKQKCANRRQKVLYTQGGITKYTSPYLPQLLLCWRPSLASATQISGPSGWPSGVH